MFQICCIDIGSKDSCVTATVVLNLSDCLSKTTIHIETVNVLQGLFTISCSLCLHRQLIERIHCIRVLLGTQFPTIDYKPSIHLFAKMNIRARDMEAPESQGTCAIHTLHMVERFAVGLKFFLDFMLRMPETPGPIHRFLFRPDKPSYQHDKSISVDSSEECLICRDAFIDSFKPQSVKYTPNQGPNDPVEPTNEPGTCHAIPLETMQPHRRRRLLFGISQPRNKLH